jgi:arginyl-tRNA synthetase
MSLHRRFHDHLLRVISNLEEAGDLATDLDRTGLTVERPHDPNRGDLSTNAALVLAKQAGAQPRQLAQQIASGLAAVDGVADVQIAGPGFINLRLTDQAWQLELARIAEQEERYGSGNLGTGKTVNVEFVSANPTGPMHMGHCRGAVVGDALANLLAFTGHRVIREYYVNDAGAQVDTLARSTHLRYREALGHDIGLIPQGLYPGEYLKPIGDALAAEFGDRFVSAPESEWLIIFRTRAVDAMMALIREDLSSIGIHHDRFSSEGSLVAAKKPEAAEAWLRARDLVYDGVLAAPKGEPAGDWRPVKLPLFRSTMFGDDQDRPIRKPDGSWTYFGVDLAYHLEKARDADELIDVWGADHAGTVSRIVAAASALTEGKRRFDVKLVQIVRLLRDGEPIKMSKRAGTFVTLADVVREVGKDVIRFTMLTRKADAQMDFDFATVVEASKENPVFYVQYAHARICSLESRALEAGVDLATRPELSLLNGPHLDLVKQAALFPRIVEGAAASREPHRIAFYLEELAAEFHALWNAGQKDPELRFVRPDDRALTRARMHLAAAIGQVIRNGLALMGVEPVRELERAAYE